MCVRNVEPMKKRLAKKGAEFVDVHSALIPGENEAEHVYRYLTERSEANEKRAP